jgi:two-component system sensor histidine kinase BarA
MSRKSLALNAWLAGLMLLLVMTAGIAATLLLARSLTRPMDQLSTAASRVSAGELDITLVPAGHDELGGLTRAFNDMARSLQEMTHGLETKVMERTQELSVANEKLKELDRLKTRFVSTASHELRTPLTSIKVYVDNLRDGVVGKLNADQQQVLRRIEDNLSRLRQLVEELLDLSRIESGAVVLTLAPLSLPDVVRRTRDALAPVALGKQIAVTLQLPGEVPAISGDAAKLEQVLTNLLHNAVKLSPIGGSVEVSLSCTDDGIVLRISDDGCGISAEDLEQIFLPFYRSRTASEQHPGAGLGLSIARHLVELHGGSLTAESQPGRGSTFSMTLPFAPPTTPRPVVPPLRATS